MLLNISIKKTRCRPRICGPQYTVVALCPTGDEEDKSVSIRAVAAANVGLRRILRIVATGEVNCYNFIVRFLSIPRFA